MSLTRTTVRELLDRHELGPSRALGQNFLCDPNMVDKIVRLAGLEPGDRVVEIGPGLGALTEALCEAQASVVAVEIDRYLLPALRETVGDYESEGRVVIINNDVRNLVWDEVLQHHDGGDQSWSIVANLPYNIATPLVLDLLAAEPRFTTMLVMVQKEAGERLVAGPGSKVYGIPSVLAAYWAETRIVANVSADLFLPRPNVESVIVRVDRHEVPPVDLAFGDLARVVRTGFGQRRKMLRRSLSSLLSIEDIEAVDVAPTARPEELSLDDWARLATRVRDVGKNG